MTREAKAAAILRAAKAAARVAKARRLSPAFDAECAANERPAGFWQSAGYAAGWLRTRWAPLAAFATLTWMFLKIMPLGWTLAKGAAFLIPVWLVASFVPRRRHLRYYLF